jgi:hypothetical protein
MPLVMSDLKDVLPVAAVAVGWALNELSQIIRARREDKKGVRKALSDLLLIRHQLIAVPRVVSAISSRLKVPPEGQVLLGSLIDNFVRAGALSKRFDDSVTLVAAFDPLLAFRLRSNDIVATLIPQLRAAALADTASTSAWPKLEGWFVTQVVPELESRILEVARLVGWWTWWRTRKRFKAPMDLPENYVESFVTMAQAAFAQQNKGKPQAASGS